MDYYIKGAVEEYLKHNRTILEGLRDQGVFSQADVESELENIKAKIEKDIETNKAYAMLLMEIEKEKYKDEDENEYVSLTEIARLKNFKNPSYVIQSWLRDRNTLDFLFQWETENNSAFDIQGCRQIERKLSDPSFTLRLTENSNLRIELFRTVESSGQEALKQCKGYNFLTITNSGELGACPWLIKSNDSIKKVLLTTTTFKQAKKIVQESMKNFLKERSEILQKHCSECKNANCCGKGCPAVSGFDLLDPLCQYIK